MGSSGNGSGSSFGSINNLNAPSASGISGGGFGSGSGSSAGLVGNPVVAIPSNSSSTAGPSLSTAGPSVSSPPAATASSSHQSPYDLRKKSPTSSHSSNAGGDAAWAAAAAGGSSGSGGGGSSCSISLAGPSGSCHPSGSQTQHQYLNVASASSSSAAAMSASAAIAAASDSCYLLPARKRPRRMYSISGSGHGMEMHHTAAHYLQYEMPDEVLLTIFSYLLEQDLCRLSLVCKRFSTIANDTELWKRLYQSVYEYDMPLFNPESCKFHFVKPDDSEYANPWKESFRQLYRGIHVRLGYQDRRYKGRNIAYFNTVQAALDCADERSAAAASAGGAGATATGGFRFYFPSVSLISNSFLSPVLGNAAIPSNAAGCTPNGGANINLGCGSVGGGVPGGPTAMVIEEAGVPHMCEGHPGAIIFLHAGHYRGEFLVIDSDHALIGAASGNVADSIVLERESESTVMFVDGAKHAYVGHMTLKFSPDVTSTVPHHKHYCLEVGENCSPTIDHCIIRSTSVGKYFFWGLGEGGKI